MHTNVSNYQLAHEVLIDLTVIAFAPASVSAPVCAAAPASVRPCVGPLVPMVKSIMKASSENSNKSKTINTRHPRFAIIGFLFFVCCGCRGPES